jgi:hypothetical protein
MDEERVRKNVKCCEIYWWAKGGEQERTQSA